ncbi:MAG: AAA family ATPase [Bacteroidota bacterium]
MTKKLFVAATGQHKGKTTCTLGIAAVLKEKGFKVGYCKPVGQNHILIGKHTVDKDVVLFEDILDFKTQPEIHSPVIIASGVTSEYIKQPEKFPFASKIKKAAAHLEDKYEVVVYEGTGHAGVGSIVGLSNAQVAKMLNAEVIVVAEGGIGSTFDRLNMNLSLFREQGVAVKGVIINKVHPDKIDRVTNNLSKALEKINIPVLGALPYDKALSFPLMGTVKGAIDGVVLLNEAQINNQVEDILAGSTLEIDEFSYFQNLLLIVTYKNLSRKIEKIKAEAKKKNVDHCPLSGVIITGYKKPDNETINLDMSDDYLKKNKVPVLATDLDTYDTVVAISQIEVKINTQTPWKVTRAIGLIQNNIPIENLLQT